MARSEWQADGVAFDDLFLHVGESALEGFEFAVEFPDAQAFVPLPVPGDEVCQRHLAHGSRGGVVVEAGEALADGIGKAWERQILTRHTIR